MPPAHSGPTIPSDAASSRSRRQRRRQSSSAPHAASPRPPGRPAGRKRQTKLFVNTGCYCDAPNVSKRLLGADQYRAGGQEDALGGSLICRQRIPLAPVDQVKGHRLLLLNKGLFLPMRLKDTDSVLNNDDYDDYHYYYYYYQTW